MDSTQPTAYLDVPVTAAERARAQVRRRDDSSDRLIPEARHPPPEDSSFSRNNPAPTRFPSIHNAPVIRNLPPSISQRIENRQYAPISPVNEEDEANSIALREFSDHKADGPLLPFSRPSPPLWTPPWLTQLSLALFALLFALLLVALTVLWHFDRRDDGFHVADGVKHYAWAYAPTVVAVILVAAWRMVDYHSKVAMPFDSLQNGPIKPSESLLVDYVSKFQLVSLYEAIRNSHFAVITTITGFVLLKVVTVFSTGLLVLLPTQVTLKDAAVQARGFSSAAFDPNAALPASPVYAYYGSMAQGMPLENGVTFDLAYGALTVKSKSSLGDDVLISGEVGVFVPFIECNKVDVQLDTPAIVNDTNSANAFATDSNISFTIQAGDACGRSSSISVPADNPYTDIVDERQVTGTMQEVYCGSTKASVPDQNGPLGLLFTLTDITYHQTLFDNATDLAGGTFTIASNVSRALTDMTNVFCKASYTMTKAKVTNDTRLLESNQAVSVTLQQGATNSTLPKFSNWNATSIFTQSSILAEALFGDTVNDDASSNSSGIFTLMALARGFQNIDSLMDSKEMASAAQDTYKGILSQYAHQVLRDSRTSDVDDGTVTREEQRLRVNDVSVWAMASIFGLLVLFCIALIFIAPRAVVPRDPSSIGALATILTRSTELNRLLRKQGAPSYENQKSALAGFEFGTAIATTDSGTTSFKVVTSEGEPGEPTTKPRTDLKWWLPVAATIPVTVVILMLPLVIIAVLEVVQRSSDKHDGLYTLGDDKWTEVYSHYVPAIIMLIIAALVNLLDFNVALFAPWTNLSKGDAVSRKSVLYHLLGMSPPLAFLRALRTRYFGALFSITAAALASILTIIVSGLYTVEHFSSNGPSVSLQQLDSFNLEWPNSFTTDSGAAAMTDLIMHQNFSYPQFTYKGLVFPKFSLNDSVPTSEGVSSTTASSSHILSAVRGNLRCEVLPPSGFNVTTQQAGPGSAFATDQAFVTATAALPDSCHLGGADGTDSFVTYENNFELPGGEGTYAGAQLDLLFGQNASLYGNYGESRGQYIGDNPAVGCPSLAFTFGHFKLDDTDKDEVTTMICYQEIQGLEANVTLKLNTTTIDPLHPPVVQDGSVFLHENPASAAGVKSFDFRIQNNLAQEMTLFNGGSGTAATNPSGTSTFDIYFQAIINGTNKHQPSSLVGSNSQDVLIDAINQFYRIYMAQAVSSNMRGPLSSSKSSGLNHRQATTASTISTTIRTPRLVQDKDSKLTLQVILGIVTIFAGAAALTTKMRHVLPCNPCSVAGSMSLLAGSDLCHSVDDGLCECCGKPRRRSFGFDNSNRPESIHMAPDEDDEDEREQLIPDGAEWLPRSQFEMVFGGKRYSMGWWRERKAIGRRRRFGVDVGVRADGSDDQDWELGERRPEGPGFGDFMVRGGDRDGRGEYSRFDARSAGAPSPDPATIEAGFPRPAEPIARPSTDPGMGRGRVVEKEWDRDMSRERDGGPGPATLARRQGSLMGGEA